jgi:hypothetical protein
MMIITGNYTIKQYGQPGRVPQATDPEFFTFTRMHTREIEIWYSTPYVLFPLNLREEHAHQSQRPAKECP